MSAAADPRRVEALAASAGGIVGLSATHLTSGERIALNEELLFPTASVIKVPLLVALYHEAAAGRVDLAERVALSAADRVAGSGVLQDLDAGLRPTLRDLATLMITVSDNEATDLVLARVGKDRLEGVMASLGLDSIRCPMSTREMLFDMVGMDPSHPGGYEENERLLREGAGDGGRAIVPEQTDRTTPRDMCRLFELLERREILDAASCEAILDTCRRQKFSTIIPARLPLGVTVAHKTGSLRGVRNDAGVVYAKRGAYAIVIFARRLEDTALAVRALADLSLAVFERFERM